MTKYSHSIHNYPISNIAFARNARKVEKYSDMVVNVMVLYAAVTRVSELWLQRVVDGV